MKNKKEIINGYFYIQCVGFTLFFLSSRIVKLTRVNFNNHSIFNNFIIGILGFCISSLFANNYFYMRTYYIRDRLEYEKQINFKRESVRNLYDEYPFSKDDILPSDYQVRNRLFNK